MEQIHLGTNFSAALCDTSRAHFSTAVMQKSLPLDSISEENSSPLTGESAATAPQPESPPQKLERLLREQQQTAVEQFSHWHSGAQGHNGAHDPESPDHARIYRADADPFAASRRTIRL